MSEPPLRPDASVELGHRVLPQKTGWPEGLRHESEPLDRVTSNMSKRGIDSVGHQEEIEVFRGNRAR